MYTFLYLLKLHLTVLIIKNFWVLDDWKVIYIICILNVKKLKVGLIFNTRMLLNCFHNNQTKRALKSKNGLV